MSSAVVSTSAALGRHFLFEDESEPEVFCHPERSGKCVKRISRGVEGSLPYLETSLDPRLAGITPASRLEIRPTPEMVASGIPALDALTGGLPRGCLTEIYGSASSGRTSVMLAALAAATRRGEYCALIDASDALDPHSLPVAGVDMDHLLWVRCADQVQSKGAPSLSRFMRQDGDFDFSRNKPEHHHKSGRTPENFPRSKFQSEHRLEQVLRVTDLLLESGGFGLILLDLADIPHQSARRIPMTTWFRFRRAVEHKPTILLALEQQPIAGSCSSLQLQLRSQDISRTLPNPQQSNSSREAAKLVSPGRKPWVIQKNLPESRRDATLSLDFTTCADSSTAPLICLSHAHLLTELNINVELVRSRLDRKPAHSVAFETKTAWAG